MRERSTGFGMRESDDTAETRRLPIYRNVSQFMKINDTYH